MTARFLLAGLLLFLGATMASFVGGAFGPQSNFAAVSEVVIPRGSSVLEIAKFLERARVVRDPLAFSVLVKLRGIEGRLSSGRYSFNPPRAFRLPDVISQLEDGKGRKDVILIQLREGETNRELFAKLRTYGFDTLTALDRAQAFWEEFPFLAGLPPDANLQGYLFPDTYVFADAVSEREVLESMLNNFVTKALGLPELKGTEAKELHERVILASLLEKEIPDFEERRLAAGILLRRIEEGIPLQVDATICYMKSLRKPASPCLPITDVDLVMDHPYNTYRNPGLPPGPIANPGIQAILAALTPRGSPYRYYLSDPRTRRTIFSMSHEEHQRAKRAKLTK